MLFWMGFGRVWGDFLMHFGPDLVDFEGSERSQFSSSKLEAEKVVSGTREGSRAGVRRP